MKKISAIISLFLVLISLCSCTVKGNVRNVEIINTQSEFFTDEEIHTAINLVKEKFVDFEGCKLTAIGYVGDKNNSYLPFEMDKPEGVILDCEFTTSVFSGGDGFNSNQTYDYGTWKWYIEKDPSGEWYIANYGVA